MSTTNYAVAQAWSKGLQAESDTMQTNGMTLYSYAHIIGETLAGIKIARCCHTSQTTACHSGLAKEVAGKVTECTKHGRPDLHKHERTELAGKR